MCNTWGMLVAEKAPIHRLFGGKGQNHSSKYPSWKGCYGTKGDQHGISLGALLVEKQMGVFAVEPSILPPSWVCLCQIRP